jgi:hypothetical protein
MMITSSPPADEAAAAALQAGAVLAWPISHGKAAPEIIRAASKPG